MRAGWLALAALAMPAASAAAADAPRGALFPRTTDGIHLEMVFNYWLGPGELGRESGAVDLVWGSSYPALPQGMYNTAYIPYSVDNFSKPVAWYQAHHPDWLEYQCDGKTLAFEFGSTTLAPLDFASPGVRAYQWANGVDWPLSQGYQGIAVDAMLLHNAWARCGHYTRSGAWVQQYSGNSADAAFRRDVIAWAAATYAHVHALSAAATMQVNVSYDFTAPLADNQRLMTTTDLLLDERGFTNWGTRPNRPTPAQWRTIVAQLRHAQSRGVCTMMNGEEPGPTGAITVAERRWVIGNYLLLKNDCSYMYMSGYRADGAQDYGRLITFPEYRARIGHPTGPMVHAQGVWQRPYSGGLVLVNPSDATATVGLPAGRWSDLEGDAAGTSVTLTRQTAQVLLAGP